MGRLAHNAPCHTHLWRPADQQRRRNLRNSLARGNRRTTPLSGVKPGRRRRVGCEMSCGRFLKDGPKSDCNPSRQGVAGKGSVYFFPKCEQLRESAAAPGTNLNNTHDPFSREAGRWSLPFRRAVSVLIGSVVGLAPKPSGFRTEVVKSRVVNRAARAGMSSVGTHAKLAGTRLSPQEWLPCPYHFAVRERVNLVCASPLMRHIVGLESLLTVLCLQSGIGERLQQGLSTVYLQHKRQLAAHSSSCAAA